MLSGPLSGSLSMVAQQATLNASSSMLANVLHGTSGSAEQLLLTEPLEGCGHQSQWHKLSSD